VTDKGGHERSYDIGSCFGWSGGARGGPEIDKKRWFPKKGKQGGKKNLGNNERKAGTPCECEAKAEEEGFV